MTQLVDETAASAPGSAAGPYVARVMRPLVTSRVVASICLSLVLIALTFVMDARGFLGTDTGGKVATLEQMIERGDWRSDVGYWAGELDEEGVLHPLYNTTPVGDQWVNATSLPMLLAARPLYDVGGYQLALLLPIAGTVAAALAAWSIAERVRDGTGGRSFWLVGLAGPLSIYALDLWEHSIGVALVAWAFVLAMDALDRSPVVVGAAMGLLFGLAATMRTEAFVYGAVVVAGTALCVAIEQRRWWRPVVLGASAAVGLVLVLAVNTTLESRLMGGSYRSGRATGTVDGIASNLGLRLKEAIVTGVGLFPSMQPTYLVLGVALLGALVYLVARRSDDRATALLAITVGLLYLVRVIEGLGFVPGLVAAAPVAAVALVRGYPNRAARLPLLLALTALPLVWLSQYSGGAVPQWAGRYILPSAVVFTAIGAALLDEVGAIARRTVVTSAVVITAFGLVWVAQRTHSVADHGEQVVAVVEDDPLISDVAFWLRELATFYEPDRPWLTAQGESNRELAVAVLEEAGFDDFWVLHLADQDAPEIPGYAVDSQQVAGGLPGVDFELSHYASQ